MSLCTYKVPTRIIVIHPLWIEYIFQTYVGYRERIFILFFTFSRRNFRKILIHMYMCVLLSEYKHILTTTFLLGPETNKYMHGKASICFPKLSSIKFYILCITHIIVIAPQCPLFGLFFSIHI